MSLSTTAHSTTPSLFMFTTVRPPTDNGQPAPGGPGGQPVASRTTSGALVMMPSTP